MSDFFIHIDVNKENEDRCAKKILLKRVYLQNSQNLSVTFIVKKY